MDSKEMIQHLANSLSLLICFVDKDEKYRFANEEYGKFFKRSTDEIVNKDIKDVLGNDGYSAIRERIPVVLSGKKLVFEVEMPSPNGVRFLSAKYVPHYLDKNKVDGWWVLAEDITEKKAFEKNKADLKDKLNNIVKEIDGLKKTISNCASCSDLIDDGEVFDMIEKYVADLNLGSNCENQSCSCAEK